MNVLFVSPYYAPFQGVGAMRMTSLSRYVDAYSKHKVTIMRNHPSMYEEKGKSDLPDTIDVIDIKGDGSFRGMSREYRKTVNAFLQKQKIDIVIISVGPYYTLELVRCIKRKYNIKVFIDFRDLWAHEVKKVNSVSVNLKRNILAIIKDICEERPAVKLADKIITVCEKDKNIMERWYNLPKEKCCCIYNGYDEEQLAGIKKDTTNTIKKEFIFGVFGKFGYYDFSAVEKIRYALKDIDKRFKILHVGREELDVTKLLSSSNNIEYLSVGMKDYKEGVIALQDADMLILVHNHESGLGTKIFDYIYLNKPILCMVPHQIPMFHFLKQFENAFICQDSEMVKKATVKVLEEHIGTLGKNIDIKKYSRVYQNEIYLKLIEDC